MSDLRQALAEALRLILSADADVRTIVSASVRFSLASTAIASLIALPAGIALSASRLRFKRIIEDVLNTMLAIPTVVVGLFVYALVYSQGSLGGFRKLSGGESQRVVLARALVLGLPIILLDEPTNSLDDASRPILLALLKKTNLTHKTTILIATRDLSFLKPLDARIIRLNEGKVAQNGIEQQAASG